MQAKLIYHFLEGMWRRYYCSSGRCSSLNSAERLTLSFLSVASNTERSCGNYVADLVRQHSKILNRRGRQVLLLADRFSSHSPITGFPLHKYCCSHSWHLIANPAYAPQPGVNFGNIYGT